MTLEQRTLKALQEANKNAYEAVASTELCGMTEREVKNLIFSVYRQKLGNFSFCGDIVAGIRSAEGEGNPTDYRMKNGDTLILDLLPRKDGVCADTTRTFFVGTPTDEQKEVFDTVAKAMAKGERYLRSGTSPKKIYKAVREALHPYEATFFHHAGHRIGFRRMMEPRFLPDRETCLRVGDIVTLEPGIYLAGRFGVRLENDYLITEKGFIKLSDFPLRMQKQVE